MLAPRPIVRAVLLLCLCAFQGQTLAVHFLACKHMPPSLEGKACAMHVQQGSESAPLGGGDSPLCTKCALTAAIGVVQGLPVPTPLLRAEPVADHAGRPAPTYYRFFPEQTAPPPEPLAA